MSFCTMTFILTDSRCPRNMRIKEKIGWFMKHRIAVIITLRNESQDLRRNRTIIVFQSEKQEFLEIVLKRWFNNKRCILWAITRHFLKVHAEQTGIICKWKKDIKWWNTTASSFYRSQNILGWSKFFWDQTENSCTLCASPKLFVPHQKMISIHKLGSCIWKVLKRH